VGRRRMVGGETRFSCGLEDELGRRLKDVDSWVEKE